MNYKKTIMLTLIIIVGIIGQILIILAGIYFYIALKYSGLQNVNIDNAKILETITSPNGTYEITSYLREGDSLVRESVLVQLKTGDKLKNIFYDYPISEVEMKWIDENTVEINGRILDVRTDTYDWRED